MPPVLGAFLGVVGLSLAETLYLQRFFPDVPPQELWLIHTIPTGFLLGFGSALALRAKPGPGKGLRCLAAALLGLVPLAVWLWLQVSVDPIHAIPLLLQLVALCAPTLLWTTLLTLIGLFNLRPARFRSKSTKDDS